jgi:hypothetical protein
MHDIMSNIKITQHVPAASQAVGNVDGTATDLAGFSNVSYLISCGTVGASGTVNAKVQYSNDGATWVDATTDETGEPVAIAQKSAVFSERLHITKPTKRFYRVRVAIGTAASVVSVTEVLGGARHLPIEYP